MRWNMQLVEHFLEFGTAKAPTIFIKLKGEALSFISFHLFLSPFPYSDQEMLWILLKYHEHFFLVYINWHFKTRTFEASTLESDFLSKILRKKRKEKMREKDLNRETWARFEGHHISTGSTKYLLSIPAHPYPNICNSRVKMTLS